MVYVIGEILVDIFRDGKNEEVFAGGAPFNVASNIANFGGDVAFYGSVGKDEYGKFLKKFARRQKLSKLLLKTSSSRDTTQAVVTLNNGERSFKFVRQNGADYALSVKQLEKFDIKKGDIVHIGSLMLSFPRGRKFFYKAVEFARERGALISFDVNYRDDIFDSSSQAKRIYKKAMQVADYLKISDEELNLLSNKKTLKGRLHDLVNDNQIVFLSLGSNGSLLKVNNIYISEPTVKVTPVDTTGAGDAFYSYVLYELDKEIFVTDEQKVHNVLSRANAVGAIATQKKGAINVVPTLKELDKYLGE